MSMRYTVDSDTAEAHLEMDVTGLSVSAGSFFVVFAFGSLFLKSNLFLFQEDRDALVQWLFAFVFALSCHLLELLLFEITATFDDAFRRWVWEINLWLLTLTLIVGLPFFHAFRFCLAAFNPLRAVVASMMTVVVFLYLFWFVGRFLPGVPRGANLFKLEQLVSRFGVLGTWLVAMLSGHAAVELPYSYLALFVQPVEAEEIAVTEEQYRRCRETLDEKRSEIESLRQGAIHSDEQKHWMRRFLFGDGASASQRRLARLETEVPSLQLLARSLYFDVQELKRDRKRALLSRSYTGHLRNAVGYFLSGYCVYRMLAAAKSLIFGEDFTSDPVTQFIGYALWTLSDGAAEIDVDVVAQYVTLLFIGLICTVSIRGFLKNMRRLLAALHVSGNLSLIVTLLTEMTGMYAISILLLIRQRLPLKYRANLSHVLGPELEFAFFQQHFNTIFLVSAMLTMVLVYAQLRAKNARSDDLLPLTMRKQQKL